MTRPNSLMRLRNGKEQRLRDDVDFRSTVFALGRRFDFSAEHVSRELHAVADSENGHTEIEDLARTDRRRLSVNGLWSAGKNDRARRDLANLVDRKIKRVNHRVDTVLANASRDQLRVLRSKIENENGLVGMHRRILAEVEAAPALPTEPAPMRREK